ncbi:MAG: hypothetical protein HLUCCO16_02950 [Phormidium sp. OSCR]|nr:MAG: hypothetical protein HLUCCO16_02950 [Phormidium sp. OSCR]
MNFHEVGHRPRDGNIPLQVGVVVLNAILTNPNPGGV